MYYPILSSRTRAAALALLLSLFLVSSSPTTANASSPARSVVVVSGGGGGGIVPRGGGGRSGSKPAATGTTTAGSSAAAAAAPSATAARRTSAAVEGLRSTLASGLAAACSKAMLAPFDTIKTVQQAAGGGEPVGMIEAIRRVSSRPGGAANLYAGLAVSAVGSMPSVGLYFGVYSYCKREIGPRLLASRLGGGGERQRQRRGGGGGGLLSDAAIKNLSIACSAAIGNTVASFSRVPYEVVKQSLQTGQYPSTFVAVSTMWRGGGMRSFFPLGGVSIQMLRDIPYAIFTLLSYEYIREHWVETAGSGDGPDNRRWLRDMAAGATAGGIGSYLTNPLDVVKTRLQTTTGTGGGHGGSIASCAAAVLEEGGPAAFLRGSVPRLMHKIPANGMFFVFYEFFKRVLGAEHA